MLLILSPCDLQIHSRDEKKTKLTCDANQWLILHMVKLVLALTELLHALLHALNMVFLHTWLPSLYGCADSQILSFNHFRKRDTNCREVDKIIFCKTKMRDFVRSQCLSNAEPSSVKVRFILGGGGSLQRGNQFAPSKVTQVQHPAINEH